jgi:hypothetical protein
MLQTKNAALLERCAQYVQELAEITYQFGGTRRAHLLHDLDKWERLLQESAKSAKPLVIRRDFASLGRPITNSHTWLEDIVDAFRFLGGEASYEDLYPTINARANRHFPREWKAVVRQTIELHSQDSANFRGCHVFDHVGHACRRLANGLQSREVTIPGH